MLPATPKLPVRRASEIHAGLEATASVFLPEWRGMEAEGEFGQALLRIIARLGEHVSTRIGKTPWRDTVAFFDSLDIPVQPPHPSSAPLVFQLGEKLSEPVFAPPGIQVGADAADGELLFETLQAVNLTPARLDFMAAVDAVNDTIELPPPGFLELEPPVGDLPVFFAASPAQAGANTIQIEPFEDLKEGNQIKIGAFIYRLGKGQDGLFQLLDALEEAVSAGTMIEKVVDFAAFHNRNLQQHTLYIGHSELLNLEQKTLILLAIAPEELASNLTGDFGVWQLYATNPDEDPAWHTLESTLESGQLVFTKPQGLKTEKVEINGIKSFWMRFLLNNAAFASLEIERLASIAISIRTPAKAPVGVVVLVAGEEVA